LRVKLTIADIFFGCWHRRLSFPFTPRRDKGHPEAEGPTGTYIVCLKCGQKFPYDWEKLRFVYAARAGRSKHVGWKGESPELRHVLLRIMDQIAHFIKSRYEVWNLHGHGR
jgi:hypothetical protein